LTQQSRPELRSLRTVVVLVLLIALGPLCTDMYLPALPQLVRTFHSSVEGVQLTLSVYLFGFGVSHLFYGSAADHFGRRPVLLAGLFIFLFSSVGCAMAWSLNALIGFRLLQSIGVSAGIVVPRAMVRDIYGPAESARVLSYMTTAMALAPIIAPVVGGILVTWLSWRAVFWILGLYGIAVMAGFHWLVPESLEHTRARRFQLSALIRDKTELLSNRPVLGYFLCATFIYAGLFCFIATSPYVLINYMGVKPDRFGFYFALPVFGYMGGTMLAARLHYRVSRRGLIRFGIWATIIGALTMVTLAALRLRHPFAVIGPQILYAFGTGLVLPQAVAGAMAPLPRLAGTASALLGFIQMSFAAVLISLIGLLHDGTSLTMSAAMMLMALLGLACFRLVQDQVVAGS